MPNFKVLLSGNPPLTNYCKALSLVNLHYTFDYSSNDCDALLLCGGGDVSPCLYGERNISSCDIDIERDCRELLLIEKFLKQGKPIFGICRGIQILNVAFGGTLKQSVKSPTIHSRLNGKCDKRHLNHSTVSSQCSKLFGNTFISNSAHHQAIKKLGKQLKISAKSLDGEIEAVEGNNIFAVQFHPERMLVGKKAGEHFFRFLVNTIEALK